MNNTKLSFAGQIAKIFQSHPLTPILAIAAILMGIVAMLITPQEEEPQIDVTMANITVPFPGASAQEVSNLVTTPLEIQLDGMQELKHVYSISQDGMALITVEFEVGVPRNTALVRLHNKIAENQNLWPQNLGVGSPQVRAMGIDDVPIMALTIWSDDTNINRVDLAKITDQLISQIKTVPGTRDIYAIGKPDRAALVQFDPNKLAFYGLSLNDLYTSLESANFVAQTNINSNFDVPVTIGSNLDANSLESLVIANQNNKPILLSDVANIDIAADIPTNYVWHGAPIDKPSPAIGMSPAITLAITKLSGTNAADISTAIQEKLANLKNFAVPENIQITISRDYGQTSADKADSLLGHLLLATISVVALVLFTLGWKEAIVVGTAVAITLMLTMFSSWATGFTINRVSLFALIFSIGILVDDAIVVVENIHRHMALSRDKLLKLIPEAVSEVGGPTILATFTVIAALLPMAFVTGLMGPYMRPIPINASAGMLLSLIVALVFTPWLSLKLLKNTTITKTNKKPLIPIHKIFEKILLPFLTGKHQAKKRFFLFGFIVFLLIAAIGLVFIKAVTLKMLPFDNKSEFQVVIDMPEGTSLEVTNQLLIDISHQLDQVPEVLNYQAYSGTSAPVTFNGLVRQYYLRNSPSMGDMQVNLVNKDLRDRQSHEIVKDIREIINTTGDKYNAAIKLVEVPPGPPVLAPIVAEIYGPDYKSLENIALDLAELFKTDKNLVDIDTSVTSDTERFILNINRPLAQQLGLQQADIVKTIAAAQSGIEPTYLKDPNALSPIPIRLRLNTADRADISSLLNLQIRSNKGELIPLSAVVEVEKSNNHKAIYRKDLRPYTYVLADDAGPDDSPLYGMFSMVSKLKNDTQLEQKFIGSPDKPSAYTVRWDGEWQITYETFRDMGIAYGAGLVLIYLLIVSHFKRYILPLIIMAPIPLTIIGVLPGHALMGAQFTATSMIGMIALAGIIVRNSILLIDFIELSTVTGQNITNAVIDAAAIRAKPIMLTAFAAMIGGFFILSDPIFQGLAVSLVFGVLVASLLTLLVIPLLYFMNSKTN